MILAAWEHNPLAPWCFVHLCRSPLGKYGLPRAPFLKIQARKAWHASIAEASHCSAFQALSKADCAIGCLAWEHSIAKYRSLPKITLSNRKGTVSGPRDASTVPQNKLSPFSFRACPDSFDSWPRHSYAFKPFSHSSLKRQL